MLITLLAAIILLGVLIAVHEYGHFWMARRFGVKIMAYAIGFGPALWRRTGRDGVDYRIGMIPLGGYVRMADETAGELAPDEMHRAFSQQSPWRRAAITAAGPAVNLLLAIGLFWVLLLFPQQRLTTHVYQVSPQSLAAQAGLQVNDRIVSVDGKAVQDWRDIHHALVDRMGESGQVSLGVIRSQQGQPAAAQGMVQPLSVPLHNFMADAARTGAGPLETLGIQQWQPAILPVVGNIEPGSAAALQGLQPGDRIRAINGKPVDDWYAMTRIVQASPERDLLLTVQRSQPAQTLTLRVMPQGHRTLMGQEVGQLGIRPPTQQTVIPAAYQQVTHYNPLQALGVATVRTADLSWMTVKSLGKMVAGLIGLENLSGPITVARIAGESARMGWEAFIGLMAVISISLGVLNLLPIPILDGGQIMYHLYEGIRGRPASERFRQYGVRVGVLLLGSMMLLALVNDVARLI